MSLHLGVAWILDVMSHSSSPSSELPRILGAAQPGVAWILNIATPLVFSKLGVILDP